MNSLRQDLKYAFRILIQSRGLSAAAILTLALGIGSSTAIFSVVHGVLLKPLPYPDPDKVVQIWQVNEKGGHMQTSDPNFEDWRDRSHGFSAIARFGSGVTSVAGGVEPVRARVASVGRQFFDAMKLGPRLGRTFVDEELKEGGSPAAIVSHGFWTRLLEADPDLSNRTLRFSNQVYSVVGVMPPGFDFPDESEIWVPRELSPRNPNRTGHNWLVVGRLKSDVALEQVRREMHALGRWQVETYGEDTWLADIDVVPLREELVGDVRPQLMILLGAVALLLLVACSDVTNLLLAQCNGQRRELAVRSALGAGRWRLIQQYLSQSLLLAALGGGLGILLAIVGVPLLLSLEPGNLPRVGEIGLHIPVLFFSLGLSITTALILGILPVVHVFRQNLIEFLNEGGRSAGSSGSARVRSGLVVAQMALTLVLLAGAGLLGRSFLRVLDVDPGFRTDNAVILKLSQASAADDAGRARLARFHADLMNRLKEIPGVTEVGGVSDIPFVGWKPNGQFMVDNNRDDLGYAEFRVASAGYFRAMQIPLLRGRLPGPQDDSSAPHVAVISQALADKKWPGEDPIGKRIQFGNMDGDLNLLHVVGIVGDILDYGLESQKRGTIYLNSQQRPRRTAHFNIVVTGGIDSTNFIPAARRLVAEMNPELPVRFQTIESVFSSSVADRRFTLILLGVFGIAALFLAAIGLFGVMAYTVSQKTAEIGVRMALGATAGDVSRLVLRQGLLWAGLGIGIGLAGALALTRTMSSFLFGIGSWDPLTYVLVSAVLLATTIAACLMPARRASRVDPMWALRGE